MRAEPEERDSRPLPREWLPLPHPPDGDPQWTALTQRILAAGDPELARLSGRADSDLSWWSRMGRWWRVAAVLAAAATGLLALVERGVAERSAEVPSPLGLVAAGGDPVALWTARGIDAHPVLASIALQDGNGAPSKETPVRARDVADR